MRIMSFGRSGGGGKSTLAKHLVKIYNFSVYHLDKYFYTDNWQEQDAATFLTQREALVNQDAWIIEGNAIHSLEIRYAQADCILMLNAPKWLSLLYIIKRRFFKNKALDYRAPNCPEHLCWKLIHYLWTFERRIQPLLRALAQKYPQKTCHSFRSAKSLIWFVQNHPL